MSNLSVGPQGITGTVTVETAAGCPWTVTSNVPWLIITSGSTGDGPGTVTFVVAANALGSRSGTLTVAGQTFTINQASGIGAWFTAIKLLLE